MSSSDTPGMISGLQKLEGWFVAIRSRVLIPLVGSSTICMKPLSSNISVNLWWIDGYGVLGFSLLFFQSHPEVSCYYYKRVLNARCCLETFS